MKNNSIKLEDLIVNNYCVINDHKPMFGIDNDSVKTKSIDWPYIIEKVKSNRVIPQFYHNTIDKKHFLPSEIQEILKRLYIAEVKQRVHQREELEKILKALNKREIDTLSIKGSVLSETVYNVFFDRQQIDIDLIIPEINALETVKQELATLGFEIEETSYSNTGPKYLFIKENADTFLAIDVETSFSFNGYEYIPKKVLWERSFRLNLEDQQLVSPCLETSIILTAVHAFLAHGTITIRDLSDILMIIRKQPFDWDYLLKISRKMGFSTLINTFLTMVHVLYDITLPAEIIETLKTDRNLETLKIQILEGLIFPINSSDFSQSLNQAIENEFLAVAGKNINPKEVLKQLSYDRSFRFCTGFGEYTGDVAMSILKFNLIIQSINVKAIEFHIAHFHFIDWISSMGDIELAMRVKAINKLNLSGEDLRAKLVEVVTTRIVELQRN